MAVTYGFYDSVAGDRKYSADQMGSLFRGIITDGIFQGIGGALVVSATTGRTINVATGRAWFNDTWTNNDAVLALTLDAAEVALNRIDRIIIEVDKTTSVRANSIKILKGSPASSPVAPTLSTGPTKYQYSLADIYVSAGATTIYAGDITNKVGTTGTPFITAPVQSLDIASLLAQYEAQFNNWFDNLDNQLTTNQASNLQSQITTLDKGYVSAYGGHLSWTTSTSYGMSAGKFWLNGALEDVPGIGRSSPSMPTSNAVYYVYLYKVSAGVFSLEESLTAPVWDTDQNYWKKTGDVTRRCVGFLQSKTANTIRQFMCVTAGHMVDYLYVENGESDRSLIIGGNASTWSQVTLSSHIPVNATHWYVLTKLVLTNAGDEGIVGLSPQTMEPAPANVAIQQVRNKAAGAGANTFFGTACLPIINPGYYYYKVQAISGSPSASIIVTGARIYR